MVELPNNQRVLFEVSLALKGFQQFESEFKGTVEHQ